jgi:mannosylglycerate hydrolase
VGDSYNYAPPSDDGLVREPESENVELLEQGPLRARALVTRTYRWPPDHLVAIETHVELRADEPFVRLRFAFDNRSEDQRVRLHIPLPRDADRSFAEGQYGVVERSPVAEGGYGEVPLPTHPAHSFVAAGGVAVLLDHALEYELVGPRELAVTLLRSTGFISRNTNPYREDPAGPEVAIPDAQMRGPWSVSLALYPYAGDRPGPDVLEQAERFRLPFLALAGAGEGELRDAAGWTLAGDGVVLTALRRRGDELEARVVNETPVAQRAVVGGAELELRPWEIRTVTSRADSDRRTG